MRRLSDSLHRMQLLDENWCVRINRTSSVPGVCVLFRVVSRLGDGVFWYALMAAILASGSPIAREALSCMLITGIAGLTIYKILKRTTSRPRPYQVKAQIRLGTAPLDHFSFPSGHTLHAVSLSIVVIAYYPALAPLLLPFAALVAVSRVILGLHYPSDVMAGALIGAVTGCAALALFA